MAEEGLQASEESERLATLVREAHEIPPDDPRRNAASIAMFEQIVQAWRLNGDERETLLGGTKRSTWSDWKQRAQLARVKPDIRERIANLFAIHLLTRSLFAQEFADRWIRQPNAAFNGSSALGVMLHGKIEDIVSVRRYLERVRDSSNAAPQMARTERPDAADARPVLEEAVATLERLVAERPGHFESTLAVQLANLAGYLLEVGEVARALQILHRAIAVRATVDPAKDLRRVALRLGDRTMADDSLFSMAIDTIGNESDRVSGELTRARDDVFTMLDPDRVRRTVSSAEHG